MAGAPLAGAADADGFGDAVLAAGLVRAGAADPAGDWMLAETARPVQPAAATASRQAANGALTHLPTPDPASSRDGDRRKTPPLPASG
jgi:hypothetical protein